MQVFLKHYMQGFSMPTNTDPLHQEEFGCHFAILVSHLPLGGHVSSDSIQLQSDLHLGNQFWWQWTATDGMEACWVEVHIMEVLW